MNLDKQTLKMKSAIKKLVNKMMVQICIVIFKTWDLVQANKFGIWERYSCTNVVITFFINGKYNILVQFRSKIFGIFDVWKQFFS